MDTFFLVIIILLVIMFLCKKSNFRSTLSRFGNQQGSDGGGGGVPNGNDFLVVCYETDIKDEHVQNLIKMLEKNNYKYKIIGNGEKWTSWYGRAVGYMKFLKTLPPNTYVMLCDGRDVLVNEDSNTFIDKALRLRQLHNNQIIIGTEPGCCTGNLSAPYKAYNIKPGEDFVQKYMEQQRNNAASKGVTNDFYYINFGLMFGTANQIYNFIQMLDIKPGLDDQALSHKIYYEQPDLLFLDHNHELFSNASHVNFGRVIIKENENLCYFKWDPATNTFKNSVTNTHPSIIQTPGKNWNCYKYLIKKLLENPEYYKSYNTKQDPEPLTQIVGMPPSPVNNQTNTLELLNNNDFKVENLMLNPVSNSFNNF